MDKPHSVIANEWAEWPTPSPTSPHNINLRFYSVVDEGATLQLDIGAEKERQIEALYEVLGLDGRLSTTVTEFEGYMRAVYQTQMASMLPYILFMVQYAILTMDTKEVQRSLDAEDRILRRAMRLMPYRIAPKIAAHSDMKRPVGWRARARHQIRYLLTWLRVSLPFG